MRVTVVHDDAVVVFDKNGAAFVTDIDSQVRLHPAVVNKIVREAAGRIFTIKDGNHGALSITDKDLMD